MIFGIRWLQYNLTLYREFYMAYESGWFAQVTCGDGSHAWAVVVGPSPSGDPDIRGRYRVLVIEEEGDTWWLADMLPVDIVVCRESLSEKAQKAVLLALRLTWKELNETQARNEAAQKALRG